MELTAENYKTEITRCKVSLTCGGDYIGYAWVKAKPFECFPVEFLREDPYLANGYYVCDNSAPAIVSQTFHTAWRVAKAFKEGVMILQNRGFIFEELDDEYYGA